MQIDIHQHIWPAKLVAALRRRRTPPQLDEWTLRLPGEPDFLVNSVDHDVQRRADLAIEDELNLVVLSLSSPLGIEYLPYDDARPLLDAFHEGSLALPRPFGVWASVGLAKPDPDELQTLLAAGCVGLQLPATALGDPSSVQELLPLFQTLEDHDKPLFVHPGSVSTDALNTNVPGWWAAVVPYVSQMHRAWFTYRASVESAFPQLRVCFAMLSGLAPLHDERSAVRGGPASRNPRLYLDTSSYGQRAIAAAAEAMGIDVIVNGSDRPYAGPSDLGRGLEVRRAIRVNNPANLLGLDRDVRSPWESAPGSVHGQPSQ